MPNQNAMIARKKSFPCKMTALICFLQVMICIAVFLFGVTLAGVLSINSMLATWNESILGSLTVQVMPINDINAEQAKAQNFGAAGKSR